jgi:predicted flap endonuclease-1-like 5' DNA nuclease
MVPAVAALTLAAAWVLLLFDLEPIPTWFYVAAWYPTLVLLDWAGRRATGTRSLFARPLTALSIGAWSVVIWLLFEAANFRLRNWYYVFLPSHPLERWLGIILSFATVVPAVVLIERWLGAIGLGQDWRTEPLRAAPATLPWIQLLGLALILTALLAPTIMFPLIWGGAWLVADPIVYRRRPEWSLLRDIEAGRWGRVARLLVGGLLIGLVWELYNGWARGRWIYTVPWLEETKLFEMPPLGFLGFPFFALEAWSLYHALCALGVARPPFAVRLSALRAGRRVRAGSIVVALVFAVATLRGMERYTISSTSPQLAQLPTVTADEQRALRGSAYRSVAALAEAPPSDVASATSLTDAASARLVRMARLTMLRGIGTRHAASLADLGIRSPCQLARWSPGSLWTAVHRRGGDERERPTPSEVSIWIRAARRACVTDSPMPAMSP